MNARGSLLGVVDSDLLCGEAPTGSGSGAKVVVLFKDPQRTCTIVVPCVAGLCSLNGLQPVGATAEAGCPWLGRVWSDAQGMQWHEPDVRRLLADPAFLWVGRSRM